MRCRRASGLSSNRTRFAHLLLGPLRLAPGAGVAHRSHSMLMAKAMRRFLPSKTSVGKADFISTTCPTFLSRFAKYTSTVPLIGTEGDLQTGV